MLVFELILISNEVFLSRKFGLLSLVKFRIPMDIHLGILCAMRMRNMSMFLIRRNIYYISMNTKIREGWKLILSLLISIWYDFILETYIVLIFLFKIFFYMLFSYLIYFYIFLNIYIIIKSILKNRKVKYIICISIVLPMFVKCIPMSSLLCF